jgi:hypothetical protein
LTQLFLKVVFFQKFMLPTVIIKIIVDYLELEDLEKLNLDILPHVEEFFSDVNWKDQLRNSNQFNRCKRCSGGVERVNLFCVCHEQQCKQPDKYYYFTFHPSYPETFLTKMISTCFSNKNNNSQKLPINVDAGKNLSREFIKKYIHKNYRHHYEFDKLDEWKNKLKMEKEKEKERNQFCLYVTYLSCKERIVDTSSEEKVEQFLLDHKPGGEYILTIGKLTRFWKVVASNPKISCEFLFRHLKDDGIAEIVLDLLADLSKHPSFKTHWKKYLSFFRQDQIVRVFGQPSFSEKDSKGDCEKTDEEKKLNSEQEFFLKYPHAFPLHLKTFGQNISESFVKDLYQSKIINCFDENKVGSGNWREFYVPDQYPFFENTEVSENLLQWFLDQLSCDEKKYKKDDYLYSFIDREKNIFEKRRFGSGQKPNEDLFSITYFEKRESIIRTLNTNHSLSEKFWEKNLNFVHWGTEDYFRPSFKNIEYWQLVGTLRMKISSISCNPNLSPAFIKKYKDRLNLVYIFRYNNQLPLYFLKRGLLKFLSG